MRKNVILSSNMWLKLLCMMLTIAMIMSFFISCSKSGDDEKSTTDDEKESEIETERIKEVLHLVENGDTRYKIVRPELTPANLMDSIKIFREKINAMLDGKTIGIAEDWLNPMTNQKPEEFEILIGKTNREETKIVLSNLKYNDYAIDIVDKKLVIVGQTEEKTIEALGYFIDHYFEDSNIKSMSFTPEQCYINRAEYEIKDIDINGISISKYKIVTPSISTNDEQNSAKDLATYISNKTGYIVETVRDSEKVEEYEILIGETNRDSSVKFNDGLRLEDYQYLIGKNNIVICGGTPKKTAKAVNDFMIEIDKKAIKSSNKIIEFSDKDNLVYKYDKYYANGIMLNGANIRDYSIIYRDNDDFAKGIARQLKNIISDKVGISIDVRSDKFEPNSAREILIGETTRTDVGGEAVDLKNNLQFNNKEGFVSTNEKYILIIGGSEGGFAKALREFLNSIIPQEPTDDVYEIAFESVKKVQAELEKVKVMSFNIWTDYWDDYNYTGEKIRRKNQVLSIIKEYMPDVIGMQEAKPDSLQYLAAKLPNYAYVSEPRDHGSYESAPIFYNKTKFNLIESGTKWLSDTPDKMSVIPGSDYYRTFTYVILENKETGTRFVHVNTHLDYNHPANEKQMAILMDLTKQFASLPIFYTADWNMSRGERAYDIITGAGFGDASRMTENSMQGGTMVGGTSMIDYCFTSSSATVVHSHEIVKNHKYSDTASDHYAIYVELSIVK